MVTAEARTVMREGGSRLGDGAGSVLVIHQSVDGLTRCNEASIGCRAGDDVSCVGMHEGPVVVVGQRLWTAPFGVSEVGLPFVRSSE